jgi:hypothetical protein
MNNLQEESTVMDSMTGNFLLIQIDLFFYLNFNLYLNDFSTVCFRNFRCFFRGNGGTVNVLRISGPQGYPECGTQRVSL